MRKIIKIILLIFLITGVWVFFGWPQIWQSPSYAAFPAFESFAENHTSNNQTQVIVDKPNGTVENNLLLAIMSHDSTSGTLSAPSGWTALFDTVNTGGSTFRAWYKIAGASEPDNYTFISSDSDQLIAGIMRFTGYDPANPINAVSNVNTGNTNSPTCASVDTTTAEALILRFFGADDDDITVDSDYPAGHTGIFVRASTGRWGETSIGAAYTTQSLAGPTGTASFSLNRNEQWGAVTIAITPLPAIAPATWKAAEDTAVAGINKGENIRLRIEVVNSGSEALDYDYGLEYAIRVGGFCDNDESFIPVPVTAAAEHFEITESTYFANGDPTTPQLTIPDAYTFVAGRMVEDPSNSSGNITLPFENYTEIEFVFQANNNAVDGENYCFRITKAGIALDDYDIYPELQIAAP